MYVCKLYFGNSKTLLTRTESPLKGRSDSDTLWDDLVLRRCTRRLGKMAIQTCVAWVVEDQTEHTYTVTPYSTRGTVMMYTAVCYTV